MGKTNKVTTVNGTINEINAYYPSSPKYFYDLATATVTVPSSVIFSKKKASDMHFPGAFDVNGTTVYIKRVIYNNPATVVFWSDGTKTISKCSEDDVYSPEMGLSNCVLKKITNSAMHNLYSTWIPDELDYSKCTEWNLENVRHKEKEEEKKLKKLKKSSKNS